MNIKSEFFKEVYYIDQPKHLSGKQWNNFLLCGAVNWNYYFLPFKTKQEYEAIKNVELLEFESEELIFEYLKILPDISFLNYSLEFEKPCLLKLV